MNAYTVSLLVFACVFGGAMLGALLRTLLPGHHLSSESKEIVRLCSGLVGTMTALVLGLLVASAKGSYDTQKSEVITLSEKVVFLDRLLAHYGPEAADAREALKKSAVAAIDRMWPRERGAHSELSPMPSKDETLYGKLLQLKPENESQQALKSQALGVATEIGQMRWLMFEQSGTSISTPFLVVIVLWLTAIFMSFGLFAPFNTTVLTTLVVGALSVACAIYLVLELDHPFEGLIRISSEPMRNAVERLGQ